MGLGLKSLTGQRKVVELLNHLGHSIGYHQTEELETKLAEDIRDRNTKIPDGLNAQQGLSTALAWDNFDELIETLSGKNTLHDTMGICYQNKIPNEANSNADDGNPERDGTESTVNKPKSQVDDESQVCDVAEKNFHNPASVTGDGILIQDEPGKTTCRNKPHLCSAVGNQVHDVAEMTLHSDPGRSSHIRHGEYEHPRVRKKQRISYHPPSREITPYKRKPRVSTFAFEVHTRPPPINLIKAYRCDPCTNVARVELHSNRGSSSLASSWIHGKH